MNIQWEFKWGVKNFEWFECCCNRWMWIDLKKELNSFLWWVLRVRTLSSQHTELLGNRSGVETTDWRHLPVTRELLWFHLNFFTLSANRWARGRVREVWSVDKSEMSANIPSHLRTRGFDASLSSVVSCSVNRFCSLHNIKTPLQFQQMQCSLSLVPSIGTASSLTLELDFSYIS